MISPEAGNSSSAAGAVPAVGAGSDDYPTIAVDALPASAGVLATELENTLAGEGWGRPFHDFIVGSHGVTFKHVERRLRLYVVDRPGRPVRCDLSCDDARVWAVMIIGPTVGVVRAASNAACAEAHDTEADLVVSLRVAGWGVDLRPNRPDGRPWATRADRRRYVVGVPGRTGGHASEWYVQGDAIDVNACGSTPHAVVAALALS